MTADPAFARRDDVRSAVRVLAIDAVAAEVCAALRNRDVPVAVLKGPVLAKQLYDGDASRTYRDTDLLVPARSEHAAYAALRDIGFVAAIGTGVTDPGVADEHQWLRDGFIVEVHVSLVGVGIRADHVWDVLASHMVRGRVGGAEVLTLDRAGLAMHVALHAAQHGVAWTKALEDLDRGLERWDAETWRSAAALAAQLRASSAFEAGLRLRPSGARVVDSLELQHPADVATALRVASAPDAAFGLERMLRRQGLLGKLAYLARAAVPKPAFMRWWSPLGRRGRVGLAVAYLYRPIWLALRAPSAVGAYLRARREARDA